MVRLDLPRAKGLVDIVYFQDGLERKIHGEVNQNFIKVINKSLCIRDICYTFADDYIVGFVWLNGRIHNFLAGYDENGVVFTIILDEVSGGIFTDTMKERPTETMNYRGINLRCYNEIPRQLFDCLGFDKDVAGKPIIELTELGRYRIQGDVVLSLLERVDFSRININDYIRYLITDMIAGFLIITGFNIRFNELRNEIFIPFVIPGTRLDSLPRDKIREEENKFISSIIICLSRYLKLIRITDVKPLTHELSKEVVFSHEFYGSFVLRISAEHGNIIIGVLSVDNYSSASRQLMEHFLCEASSIAAEEYTFKMGNHKITIKNILPTTVQQVSKIRPTILPGRLMTWNLEARNGYLSLKDATVILEHPEHGRKIVRIGEGVIFNFDTVHVNRVHDGLRNYVLKSLLTKPQTDNTV